MVIAYYYGYCANIPYTSILKPMLFISSVIQNAIENSMLFYHSILKSMLFCYFIPLPLVVCYFAKINSKIAHNSAEKRDEISCIVNSIIAH